MADAWAGEEAAHMVVVEEAAAGGEEKMAARAAKEVRVSRFMSRFLGFWSLGCGIKVSGIGS